MNFNEKCAYVVKFASHSVCVVEVAAMIQHVLLRIVCEYDQTQEGSENFHFLSSSQECLSPNSSVQAAISTPNNTHKVNINQITSELSSITFFIAEMLASRCCKYLKFEYLGQVTFEGLVQLHSRMLHFSKILEHYTGRSNYSIKAVLLSQVLF